MLAVDKTPWKTDFMIYPWMSIERFYDWVCDRAEERSGNYGEYLDIRRTLTHLELEKFNGKWIERHIVFQSAEDMLEFKLAWG
jgi:hypothetical protein